MALSERPAPSWEAKKEIPISQALSSLAAEVRKNTTEKLPVARAKETENRGETKKLEALLSGGETITLEEKTAGTVSITANSLHDVTHFLADLTSQTSENLGMGAHSVAAGLDSVMAA